MIYTLTFNPAVDYVVRVSDYSEGKVNRTVSEEIFAGGKGINVSVILKNLGLENTALGFISGFTGNLIESILNKEQIKTDFIRLDNGFSRINVKIKADKETEINAKGPIVSNFAIEELYKKLDKLKNEDVLILAGSVPESVSSSVYCDIMQYLHGKNIYIVVDATGDLLLNTLKFEPFLIKPNNFELEEIFGEKNYSDEQIIECAIKLQNKGAKNVLVSLGECGGILITQNGEIFRRTAPEGEMINTTGSGDSMVAGFVAGYLKKRDYEYALKMGICAGSASAFSNRLATGEEIMQLFKNMY